MKLYNVYDKLYYPTPSCYVVAESEENALKLARTPIIEYELANGWHDEMELEAREECDDLTMEYCCDVSVMMRVVSWS